ncbi:MAG: hypothetical protein HC919_05425 [Oscillatoriales cyanobacterium SM2_2_1]|nr:hypothetical protein [Oscillatoriales cyanobacterium SM2_2_1]
MTPKFWTAVALGSTMVVSAPVWANCIPLPVVGGSGTRITKKLSPGGTLVTGDNWNTDFVVPTDRVFSRFVVTVTPRNQGSYSLNFYLKYPDNSADRFFSREPITLEKDRPVRQVGRVRSPKDQPFQVNVFVGGFEAIGNTVQIQVDGCTR